MATSKNQGFGGFQSVWTDEDERVYQKALAKDTTPATTTTKTQAEQLKQISNHMFENLFGDIFRRTDKILSSK